MPKQQKRDDHAEGQTRVARFARGLADGLASASRTWDAGGTANQGKRYPVGGIKRDWRAVGGDIRTALSKYE